MNMKKRTLRALCLVISVILILTMCTSCGLVNIIVDSIITSATSTANGVDFEKLEYERPDFEALRKDFEDLIAQVKKQPNYLILNFSANDTLTAYQDAMTMYTIAQLRYYANVNDTEAEDEINYCAEEFAKLDSLVNEFYAALIEYGYRDTLLYGMSNADLEYIEIRKNMFDEEYESLTAERTRLENEYMALPTEIVVATENGTDYSISEYQKQYQSGKVDAASYKTAVEFYYSELASRSYPIYMRMIEIDNAIAAKAGFDSYVEYSYKYVYFRDYDPTVSDQMAEKVKKELVPLYLEIMSAIDSEVISDILSRDEHTIEGYDSIISEYAQEVSPAMYQAYKDLKKYNLSIIGSEEGMQQAGFTTYLYTYELPFMYIYTYGDIDDINTFVHEFGHFYSFHYNTYETDNIIDISEIQSQASEWLFLPYYDLTDEELAQYTLYRLSNTLSNIIEGCLYDEFQRTVYTKASELKSVDDLNVLFESIAKEYSYDYMYPGYDIEYLWSGIHHNFTAPFYYISYAVSAIPALEIYSISLEDREEAIDIYNKICDDSGTNEYLDKLAKNGLSNPFDEETDAFDIITELVRDAIAATQSQSNAADQLAA